MAPLTISLSVTDLTIRQHQARVIEVIECFVSALPRPYACSGRLLRTPGESPHGARWPSAWA